MNAGMKIGEFRERLAPAVESWAHGLIDGLAGGNARLVPVSAYLKRGVSNWIARNGGRLSEAVEGVSLFVCDADGNIDAGTVFDDFMAMFRAMGETRFGIGPVSGTAGGGRIRLELPDGFITSVLFGDTRAVTITENDFAGLRDILAGGRGKK